ncbi:MAG: Asp23/Gls24 family envelope stress response protein [Firmicutes bacterium]|nr:Asp23/Gls24 family envelope stress response protein [Bacillota bacterium]
MERDTGWGKLSVHPEVLAEVVSEAVEQVAHGFRLVSGERGLRALLRGHESHAVVVEEAEGALHIHLHLAVEFGRKLSEIARVVSQVVDRALWEAVEQHPQEVVVHVVDVYPSYASSRTSSARDSEAAKPQM